MLISEVIALPMYQKKKLKRSGRIGLIGHSGLTMAKVDVPCVFKNPSGK